MMLHGKLNFSEKNVEISILQKSLHEFPGIENCFWGKKKKFQKKQPLNGTLLCHSFIGIHVDGSGFTNKIRAGTRENPVVRVFEEESCHSWWCDT